MPEGEKSAVSNSTYYSELLDQYLSRLMEEERQARLFSYARLLIFALLACLTYLLINNLNYLILFFQLFLLVLFFQFIKLQLRAKEQAELFRQITDIIKQELKAIKGNFSSFQAGSEFIGNNHPYTSDLDVFGEKSIFQLLNRCTSDGGQERLASWLKNISDDPQMIKRFQRVSMELKDKREFFLYFKAYGKLAAFSSASKTDLSLWLNNTIEGRMVRMPAWFFVVLPVITLSLLALFILGTITYHAFAAAALVQLGIVYSQSKTISSIYKRLDKKYKLIQSIKNQIVQIERETFESARLVTVQLNLESKDNRASDILQQLAKIMRRFDSRLNVIGAILFNALFMYELNTIRMLRDWKAKHGKSLSTWFDQIFDMEAFTGLGNFAFNHPEYVYPELTNNFSIKSVKLKHPLMSPIKAVGNDFEMEGKGSFMIITGSNMSGKSTYLRTIGANVVLAQMGLPVNAASFEFSPVKLHTSMRIADSLQHDESYFYAEIKRLRQITNAAKEEENVFILLDEVLRGTNSNDKHAGSEALMKKLVDYGASGILATHDLSLSVLEKEQPKNFKNKTFESEVVSDELLFDYKIRDGVCANLNAVFLMKKMGIM